VRNSHAKGPVTCSLDMRFTTKLPTPAVRVVHEFDGTTKRRNASGIRGNARTQAGRTYNEIARAIAMRSPASSLSKSADHAPPLRGQAFRAEPTPKFVYAEAVTSSRSTAGNR